ncbi:hypothetical protein [Nocardioides marmotae]|uniref:hypothetical protein n=1 Tax=Nocardioides marmotae TaxID=2663857 RepID=UPI0012B615B9|nr:hypothetical protein [Nocardioides marmotae]MBC9731749.1 hypothetical protein [Nocardioides marmotae]MTB82871.1 hypothetical protein [Nocardioides marmotae]
MRRRTVGSLVGAAGGLAFVLVNAAGLAGAWPLRAVAVVLAVALAVATLVAGIRSRSDVPPPTRAAVRTYGWCVVLMVLGIVLGARLLALVDRSELTLPWVVGVVGLHFWPFARVFAAPVFARLAAALVLVALAGATGVVAGLTGAPAAIGVAAGFVLLTASLAGELGARSGAPVGPAGS